MIDCSKCKHSYFKKTGEYSAISACDLSMPLKRDDGSIEMPNLCSAFELRDTEGLKYDNGKNRMGLMCENFSRALWEVGKVSTFGANKYSDNSWQNLSNPKMRYMDALCRHLFKHLQGEKVDSESKLLHLSHLAWNALCLLEFELKDNENDCRRRLGLKLLGSEDE